MKRLLLIVVIHIFIFTGIAPSWASVFPNHSATVSCLSHECPCKHKPGIACCCLKQAKQPSQKPVYQRCTEDPVRVVVSPLQQPFLMVCTSLFSPIKMSYFEVLPHNFSTNQYSLPDSPPPKIVS